MTADISAEGKRQEICHAGRRARSYHRRVLCHSAAAIAIIAPLAGTATTACAQTADQPAADASPQLEEVTVFAQRVQENQQIVPVSVTTLDTAKIEAAHVESTEDLSYLVPGFVAEHQGGYAFNPVLTMRGVIAGVDALQVDTGIGTYIDGVYLGRVAGAIFNLADIDRVEVDRGPQGTLFGRNITGGVVSYSTRAPTGTFAIQQDLTFGNFGKLASKTRVDLPEWNGISVAITYLHSHLDGWVKNLGAGTTLNISTASNGRIGNVNAADEFGMDDTDAVAATIRYKDDRLTIDFKADYADETASQEANQILGFVPGGGGAAAQYLLGAQPALGGTNIVSRSPLGAVPEPTQGADNIQPWGVSGTATYAINDWLTAKDITAYRQYRLLQNGNSFDGNTLFTPAGFGPVGAPFTILGSYDNVLQHQVSQEVQLIGKTDLYSFTGGVYYFDERGKIYNPLIFFQSFPNNTLPALAPNGQFNDLGFAENESTAVYFQGTLNLTDKLDVTAGGRQTWDNRTDGEDLLNPQGTLEVFKKSFSNADWQTSLRYFFDNDLMGYVKVATGTLSGGIYHGVPFSPEHIRAYEIGEKAEFLDRRVRLNSDLFYENYHDKQTEYYNGVVHIVSFGHEFVKGIESELDVIPIERVTLSANGSWESISINDEAINIPGAGIISAKSNAFGGFPSGTATLSAEYAFPDMPSGGHVSLSANAAWRDRVAILTSPVPEVNAVFNPPGHWQVGARVAVVDVPLGGGTFKAGVWVANLLNNRLLEYGSNIGTVYGGHFQEPRTFGLDLSFRFGE